MENINSTRAIRFATAHILDAAALCRKLNAKATLVGEFLVDHFTDMGRAALELFRSSGAVDDILHTLIYELNRIVEGKLLYDADRFAGVTLRTITRELLNEHPEGQWLMRLNRLLLEDSFIGELAHDSSEPADSPIIGGIQFHIYKETRVLKTKVGVSFKIVYPGPDRSQSVHARTLEAARAEAATLAENIKSGKPPLTRDGRKQVAAKAVAYDQIKAECLRIQLASDSDLLRFMGDCVRAQELLGPKRPILHFVQKAEAVMPKPEQRVLLSVGFRHYKVFEEQRPGPSRRYLKGKFRNMDRFINNSSHCERLARQLVDQGVDPKAEPDPAALPLELLPQKLADPQPGTELAQPELYADEITSLGIAIFLRLLGTEWKSQRDYLDTLRNYLAHLRDRLHALPQGLPSAADLVTRPKRKGQKAPVTVLWFDEVWRIFLNVQDLETLFFVALGVYAGLRHTEILRLQWQPNILRDADGEPNQIYIPPGMGKEPGEISEGRYVKIRYPLNKILMLGSVHTGFIVNNRATRGKKLTPLLNRLQIACPPSVMRHACASNLHGAGITLEAVADQLRDRLGTVSKHYLRHLSEFVARLFWTVPVDLSVFNSLPSRCKFWDVTLPLKSLVLPGIDVRACVRGELEPTAIPKGPLAWQVVSEPAREKVCQPASTGETPARRKRHRKRPRRQTYTWPDPDEFLVLLYDKTQEQIALQIGAVQTAVSAHAIRRGFKRPDADHWRRKKAGLPVDEPEEVKQARKRLEQKFAKLSNPAAPQAPPQNSDPGTAGPDSGPSNPS